MLSIEELEEHHHEETQMETLSFSPQAYNILPAENAPMDEKALRMMQKMGYKLGSGLGKDEQGITETIKVNTNLGRRGLGLTVNNLNLSDNTWDFSLEDIVVEEKVQWLKNTNFTKLSEKDLDSWIVEGPPNNDVISNSDFCDKNILKNVFDAKNIFDELDLSELLQARAKSNPFETVRSMFFMNRAALKIANIDAATDFMFTNMEHNNHFKEEQGPIYFTDVCAGPGGFTEYILWRKGWFYKGFGMTLSDEHDFKVSDSTCAPGASFQALYGKDETGDVCNPENIVDFTEKVKNETEMQGVHFMMSDGGFCVDGNENLQEILSKNIYICQCLIALQILRPHGCFVTKVFDIFTPFSVGLLYLTYLCFKEVGILKPNTSRPANSERYFICSNLKVNARSNLIREYLWKIVIRLWEVRNLPDRDVLEIVPMEVLKKDASFLNYIIESNNRIGRKQIIALNKLAQFCRNPGLIDVRQDDLRRQCLEYWKIPDEKRRPPEECNIQDIILGVKFTKEIFVIQPRFINCEKNLDITFSDICDWHYTYLLSSHKMNRLNFYAGIGKSKVRRLQNHKWVKVNNLELVPGTLLYGEFVKETSILDNNEIKYTYSLHVIDAVYLGYKDLQGLTFRERSELIKVYCKAVNKESQSKFSVRVRAKTIKELCSLPQDDVILEDDRKDHVIYNLPKIGYKALAEHYDVNSILLLKTNNSQTFQSTHVLRVQIFNSSDANSIQSISFEDLKKHVERKLIQ